jgi:hypothetical protein
MSDLKLVPPHEPTELERLLLEAAANEKPSDEHKLRVREALGLAIPLSLPVPTGAETQAAAATSSAGTASSLGAATLAKAVVGGVVGATAVGTLIFALVAPQQAPRAPAPTQPVVEQKAPVAKPAIATPVAEPEAAAVPVSELAAGARLLCHPLQGRQLRPGSRGAAHESRGADGRSRARRVPGTIVPRQKSDEPPRGARPAYRRTSRAAGITVGSGP